MFIAEECSVDDSAIEQQKVQYFELKSTIETALVLQPFLSSTNAAISILSGQYCIVCAYIHVRWPQICILSGNEQLYADAERLTSVLNSAKQQRLEELRQGIVKSSNLSPDSVELDMVCESAAVNAAVYKLQERIELVYLTAQRRHANIQRTSSNINFSDDLLQWQCHHNLMIISTM